MRSSVIDSVRRYFLSGVLVVVPLILTWIVLKFMFEAIDGILEPILTPLFGYYIPGLGLVTTLLLIILAGVLTRNFIGNRIYRFGDRLLARLPVIRLIYSAAKQLLEALASSDKSTFKEVGMIVYPRAGSYALCFVSRRITIHTDEGTKELLACFVPSTPTPISGTVIMVPESDVLLLDMSVEDGIKFLVSGGVASPSVLRVRPGKGRFNSTTEVVNEAG